MIGCLLSVLSIRKAFLSLNHPTRHSLLAGQFCGPARAFAVKGTRNYYDHSAGQCGPEAMLVHCRRQKIRQGDKEVRAMER